MAAFFAAGMVCQSDHAEKEQSTGHAVAFADQLRAATGDEAFEFT